MMPADCRMVISLLLIVITSVAQGAELHVVPEAVELQGHFDQVQVLVAAGAAGATAPESADLTHQAVYATSDPQVFSVSETGRLTAVGEGDAVLRVEHGGATREVPVQVRGLDGPPRIDFDHHVLPILSKAGCNMGACHASQHGKGGFKLSVFGFEPRQDHTSIVRDRLARRIDLLNPSQSLLLQKPSMQVAHGGGLRLPADSLDFEILHAWLAHGAGGPTGKAAAMTSLDVAPARRVGTADLRQQLRVMATYSDGTRRDVTRWAKFDSMDDGVLAVTDTGHVQAVGRGQATVMARFEGHATIAVFSIPYSDTRLSDDWESFNFVDQLAAEKFQELGIQPSPQCDDATFIRRVFLDIIGTLPPAERVEPFLASDDPHKREQLVDQLLGLTGDPEQDIYNEAYAAYWTLKWSDLIRNTSNKLGDQGMWALHNWIRQSFRENRPFDAFVHELVTGKGSIYSNGPANYFRINQNSSDLAESTSQLFLGIRLECAKCHHHPFENFSQTDYYGFAAFFARVGTKRSEEFGLFGREQVVMVRPSGEVRHPKTGKNVPPTPLGAEPTDHALDRRIALAEWLTAKDNEYFAKSVVNRYMYYLLGRGLVEPVDDLRSTNPPTNVALMDALTEHFRQHDFDLKQLIRVIAVSRLYQLDSQPTPENAADDRFYSHFKVKRLSAEVLLDAIDQVTDQRTKFRNLPRGTRAIALPDAEYPNYFLKTFAKPRRASVCECERSPDESLAQALHTLNGDTLVTKIGAKEGRLARLLAGERPHDEIVRELYLTALCRPPREDELHASRRLLDEYLDPVSDEDRAADEKGAESSGETDGETEDGAEAKAKAAAERDDANKKSFYEDLLWALMNSKQFLYVH